MAKRLLPLVKLCRAAVKADLDSGAARAVAASGAQSGNDALRRLSFLLPHGAQRLDAGGQAKASDTRETSS